jgi:hypothetical protein
MVWSLTLKSAKGQQLSRKATEKQHFSEAPAPSFASVHGGPKQPRRIENHHGFPSVNNRPQCRDQIRFASGRGRFDVFSGNRDRLSAAFGYQTELLVAAQNEHKWQCARPVSRGPGPDGDGIKYRYHMPTHTNDADYRSGGSGQVRYGTRFSRGFNLIGKHCESFIADGEGQQVVKFSRLSNHGIGRRFRMLRRSGVDH